MTFENEQWQVYLVSVPITPYVYRFDTGQTDRLVVNCVKQRRWDIITEILYVFTRRGANKNRPKGTERGEGPLDFLAEGPDWPPKKLLVALLSYGP